MGRSKDLHEGKAVEFEKYFEFGKTRNWVDKERWEIFRDDIELQQHGS